MSSIQLNEQPLDEKLAQLEEARSWSSRVISIWDSRATPEPSSENTL